jgi:hypothetical protein
VAEPKIVDFKPRWMRELTAEDRRILDDFAASGSVPPGPPRIHARLLPVGGSNLVSAKTLGESITLTQSIVQYAGYDVYHGVNPDFADLRSLSAPLVNLTKLTVEPFAEGSFVIPARLEAGPLAVEGEERPRQVTADDVIKRFDEILAFLREPSSAVQVSIGAIQTVEALGRVIRREAEAIEFVSIDTLGQARQPLRVDEVYVSRVQKVRESRRPAQARLETLEGQVTALDIREGKLQLSIEGRRRRVTGHFAMLFLPSLLASLGRTVRLHGHVQWQRGQPVSIQVVNAELPADES